MNRYKILEEQSLYYQNKVMRLDYVLNHESSEDSYFDLDTSSDYSDYDLLSD